MPYVALSHGGAAPQRPAPPQTMRTRALFVGYAFVKGVATFSGKLAALSGFVGGSVATYLIFVSGLTLPWALVIALAALLVVFVIGAYRLWDEAYRAAWRFTPTWEHCQTRADTLRALTEEYRYDGSSGRLLDPDQVNHDRRVTFRRQYMAGHMAATRADFDRACAAGYPPDFDRDRIGSADLGDVVELAERLEDVAQRWRDAERQTY